MVIYDLFKISFLTLLFNYSKNYNVFNRYVNVKVNQSGNEVELCIKIEDTTHIKEFEAQTTVEKITSKVRYLRLDRGFSEVWILLPKESEITEAQEKITFYNAGTGRVRSGFIEESKISRFLGEMAVNLFLKAIPYGGIGKEIGEFIRNMQERGTRERLEKEYDLKAFKITFTEYPGEIYGPTTRKYPLSHCLRIRTTNLTKGYLYYKIYIKESGLSSWSEKIDDVVEIR